ncbi:MAG TPA: VOC family protein [Thermoplasmataceae archaeon]|nr:hypothetical protein [Thermoplasmatales archaeon AK]HLH85849.1 VOC family protein [Thermoplasmataceae archaeon]
MHYRFKGLRIFTNDLDTSKSFYMALFGIRAREQHEDWVSFDFSNQEIVIHYSPVKIPGGGIELMFETRDFTEVVQRLKSLSIEYDSFRYEGKNILRLTDPDENIIVFEEE